MHWMYMLEELYLTEHLLIDVELKEKDCSFVKIANISSVILPHTAHCRQCMRSLCDSNSVFCMRVVFFCSVHIASLCSLLIQASH